jgi:PHP family Zn ribbon phosphoesterase
MLADLHNHSCLSPCASLEMSPNLIAKTAAGKGIGMLALTDHNCARNCPAFADACKRHNIIPIFGMEVTTREECHVLSLFDDLEAALEMNRWISAAQPRTALDPTYYSDQPVVDTDENIIELLTYFLGQAITHSLETVMHQTHLMGGLFIPSHINRYAFSIESQLGFLPEGDYDAIEVMPGSVDNYKRRYPNLPVITASDAHCPEQIGTYPFHMELDGNDLDAIKRGLMKLIDTPGPHA